MNRRKSEHRVHASAYFALIAAAIVAAAGGVLHAYYKNRQVQVAREVDLIERRIEQHQLEIRTTEYRADELLNRFVIKKQLEDAGSTLVAIPVGLPEDVNPPTLDTPLAATAGLTP